MPPWCDHVVAGEAKDKLTIGYEDKQAAANKLQTERAPVSEFARFMGYETEPRRRPAAGRPHL